MSDPKDADGRSAAVPDLDVPGASRASRSQANFQAVKVPSGTSPHASPAATGPTAPAAKAPESVRERAAPASAGRSIAFGGDDDDDFGDMEIERNLAPMSSPAMPTSRSDVAMPTSRSDVAMPTSRSDVDPRPSGLHGAARAVARSGGSGLEISHQRVAPRPVSIEDEGPGIGVVLGGYAIALALLAGTGAALHRFAHRRGGYELTRLVPHAFDGTSAPESGAVALTSLAVAVTIGFVGLRLKPHAWSIVASGGAMLLLALAMVTVTLASTGENPTPPDGVLLVPYLVPAALLLFAVGVCGRAARVFAHGYGVRRGAIVPLAAIAGCVAFLSFEVSRFGR